MIFGRCLSLWKDSQITNIKILPGVEMKMKKKNVHTAKRMEIPLGQNMQTLKQCNDK